MARAIQRLSRGRFFSFAASATASGKRARYSRNAADAASGSSIRDADPRAFVFLKRALASATNPAFRGSAFVVRFVSERAVKEAPAYAPNPSRINPSSASLRRASDETRGLRNEVECEGERIIGER